MSETNKDKIYDVVERVVDDLLYYDRKEDEDVPVGYIDNAVNCGEISVVDIIHKFADELIKGLK